MLNRKKVLTAEKNKLGTYARSSKYLPNKKKHKEIQSDWHEFHAINSFYDVSKYLIIFSASAFSTASLTMLML